MIQVNFGVIKSSSLSKANKCWQDLTDWVQERLLLNGKSPRNDAGATVSWESHRRISCLVLFVAQRKKVYN